MLDEALRPMGVEWRALVVLLVVAQSPGITQGRLTPFVQTDKANLTKLLQALEGRGLIERRSDGQDRRIKSCHLTEQGKALVPDLYERLNRWEADCFAGVGDEDRRRFNAVGDRVTQNLLMRSEWGGRKMGEE